MIVDQIKKRENKLINNKNSRIDIPVGKWVKCENCKEILYNCGWDFGCEQSYGKRGKAGAVVNSCQAGMIMKKISGKNENSYIEN